VSETFLAGKPVAKKIRTPDGSENSSETRNSRSLIPNILNSGLLQTEVPFATLRDLLRDFI
jgi:hypothetical protein